MRQLHFFQTLAKQWEQKLPFVVYKKPNSEVFRALMQKDASVHYTQTFNEPGFVFAPFDTSKPAILLHADKQLSVAQTKREILNKGNSDPVTETDSLSIAKKSHIALVNKALQLLEHEELQKVVLSRTEKIQLRTLDFLEKFQELSTLYPTAMVYCWYHPKVGLWMGATPETLLLIQKNILHTMALAGTQAYSETLATVWGKKELEEQQLVTDAIKEGLTPLVDEISVSKVYTHKAGDLVHLRTDFTAAFSKIPLEKIIRTLHPTPAVCGLPKESAKQFILRNEGYDREFYTGFLGELHLTADDGQNGERVTNLFVNLRCMQLKAKQVQLYVGGGITKASVAVKEWEETVKKTNTMKSVL